MFNSLNVMTESPLKYGFIRLAVVSPELRVADVEFNTKKIISAIESSVENNSSLILFPELSVTGYSCADLFYQHTLLDSTINALKEIARATEINNCTTIIGCPIESNGKLFNCAVVISNGIIKGIVPKTFLPNTNEYYEKRWFSSEMDRITDSVTIGQEVIPFGADLLFQIEELPECVLGIEICEDLWTVLPPSQNMALASATLLLNLSAGDELLGKVEYRRNLVISQSARCISAYAYSSAGPGESSTDMVFSGHCLIAENGILLSETQRFEFETQIAFADIDIQKMYFERLKNNSFSASAPDKQFRKIAIHFNSFNNGIESTKNQYKLIRKISQTPFVPSDESARAANCKEIFSIQTTALAKRLKHINCKDTVIGLSGGLDSTLALLVIYKTYEKLGLDKKGIHAITMPGFGTTDRTRSNAEELANLLSVDFNTIPISDAVELHFRDIAHDLNLQNIVYENAQARERTQILMDIANQVGGIVIGTGDLSELALGWSTYNGDHMSMYGVNAGVPKTLVKYIVSWCADEEFSGNNSEQIIKILRDIVNTPISPELLPAGEDGKISQETENEIGPYILHDFFLYYVVRFAFSPKKILWLAEIAFEGVFGRAVIKNWLKVFYNRFFKNQFKRSCIPDGVKVGTVSLSPRSDWRMPSDACAGLWLDDLDSI